MNNPPPPKPKTPEGEALEWALISGALVAVAAYMLIPHGALLWLAQGLFAVVPQLAGIRMAHAPELVASGAIGMLACIGICVVIAIVGVDDRMERQAERLKKRRDKRQIRLNGRSDRFIVQ